MNGQSKGRGRLRQSHRGCGEHHRDALHDALLLLKHLIYWHDPNILGPQADVERPDDLVLR